MDIFSWQIALMMLGLILAIALWAGGLAEYLRIPKVTAYLLVGVLLGPGILGWIGPEQVELFEPLTKLAFPQILAHIEHSHNNTYPVTGHSGELIGVIRYREVSSALFDPQLNTLVRATDVTTPAGWVLHPEDPISRAYDMFHATKDDCLPVVTLEEPYRLVGLVRRRDMLRMLIRGQIGPQEPTS